MTQTPNDLARKYSLTRDDMYQLVKKTTARYGNASVENMEKTILEDNKISGILKFTSAMKVKQTIDINASINKDIYTIDKELKDKYRNMTGADVVKEYEEKSKPFTERSFTEMAQDAIDERRGN